MKKIKALLYSSTMILSGCLITACEQTIDLSIPVPNVNAIAFNHLAVGDTIELRGENIHLITSVTFDGVAAANIPLELGKRSRTLLKLAVPSFTKDSLVKKVEAIYNSRHAIPLLSNIQIVLVPTVLEWTKEVAVNGIIELRGNSLLQAKKVFINNIEVSGNRNDLLLTITATPNLIGTHIITILYDNILGHDQLKQVGSITIHP